MTLIGGIPDRSGDEVERALVAVGDPSLSTWLAGTILRWRWIARGVAAAWATAIVLMLVLPPAWRASATFSPNLSPGAGGASRLAGAIGSLTGAGGALGGSLTNQLAASADPSESPLFYEKLLTSRELLSRLLLSRFPDYRTDAPADSATLLDLRNERTKNRRRALEIEIKALQDEMRIAVDQRANLVSVSVDAEWAPLAPRVTQRLLDLVNDFNLQQRQTRGRVRRVFLAGRVDSTRADLDRATRVLRDFEVLNRDWTQSPTLKARHADLQRQQGIAEDLYVSTRREYEQARVAEVNDAALITVIDSPVQPEKKQFPRIGLTLGVATVLGTVVGGLVAILGAAAADWGRADPLARRAVAAALAQARADVRRLRRG